MAAICSLIRAYNWRIEDVGRLSWGQVAALNDGLRELQGLADGDEKHERTTEERMADEEYQNAMARTLLKSRLPNGELDMDKMMRSVQQR